MVRQRKKLGQFIKDCKEKYHKQKIPNFQIHVSNYPRKILFPKITPFTWDIEDSERSLLLLFLSPVQEVSNWLSWCYYKEIKRMNKYGYFLLFVYIEKPKKMK